ncbi:hypothetical protein STAS_01972 [Striga asiatica]|uniref:Uncharacterized protein n=1 Tax=Striga asiatica TaxID=4170 RepID=A0A5A7P0N2_STRAF|nr:hypothetical protein STAS_01972 [Striga asiatica]
MLQTGRLPQRFYLLGRVAEPAEGVEGGSDLRLEESGPWICAVGGSQEAVEMSDVEIDGIWEAGEIEVGVDFGVLVFVGKVLPQGDVGGRAVGAAGGEGDVDGVAGGGDGVCPAGENVGDYAERGFAVGGGDLLDEGSEGGFEAGGGVEEVDDEVEGEGFGVLGVWREAVAGGVELQLGDMDVIGARGRVGGHGGAEVAGVEWGSGDGDGEAESGVYSVGQCEERDEMALRHEW